MTLEELRAAFRLRADDTAPKYLWDDAEIDGFANAAEREACVRGRLIVDSADLDVCRIAVSAGVAGYALSPLVIALDEVRLVSSGKALRKVHQAEADAWAAAQSDVPLAWLQQDSAGGLRLLPTPQADDVLALTVTRLPLRAMVGDGDVPEIAAMWHERLLDWMLHLAYLKRDADTAALELADRYAQRFAAWFGGAVSARLMEARRVSAPGYGFEPVA